ncbi:10452_t:CDS:2, partial [Racocetra persica]
FNNNDFYYNKTIDMNIFDQNDKSEEIQKKIDKKEYYEAIDINELNQNNKSKKTQKMKRIRKNTVHNSTKE